MYQLTNTTQKQNGLADEIERNTKYDKVEAYRRDDKGVRAIAHFNESHQGQSKNRTLGLLTNPKSTHKETIEISLFSICTPIVLFEAYMSTTATIIF